MPLTPPLRIVDAHCDTLWAAPREKRALHERSERGHLDLPRLQEAGVYIQFFAVFSDPMHAAAGFTADAGHDRDLLRTPKRPATCGRCCGATILMALRRRSACCR